MPREPEAPDHEDQTSTAIGSALDRRGVAAILRVEDATAAPETFVLGTGSCRVGSAADNDIVISDKTVSRHHAHIELVPEGVRVVDHKSHNGTFYLGQRVADIVLSLGSRVTLGNATLVFEPDARALFQGAEFTESSYAGILGCSLPMRRLFAVLQRLEGSLAPVLIEGESGSGKERVARAIHDRSRVEAGPLVAVNCGAIAPDLVASELFGHKRGAFTGATDNRRGAFESAGGGTLFLDEIGELPLGIQPALLRALESGEIRAVGDDRVHHVKVRVIAATNRDLAGEVRGARFREDLFYRLAVVRIQVPPLRGRPDDIELLAKEFATQAGLEALPGSVMELMKTRGWRGNARELRNAVMSFAAVGELPPELGASHSDLELALLAAIDPGKPYAEQKDLLVEQLTRVYLSLVLKRTGGNQSAAARAAEMDRTYFGKLVAKYGLGGRRDD